MKYFEDYAVDSKHPLGEYHVSGDEIVEFAKKFDPQPYHLGLVGSDESEFGGLIASGWHVASMFMRLFVTNVINDSSAEVSPGVDKLRWLRPVRAGDALTGELTVTSTAPSLAHRQCGITTFEGGLTANKETSVLQLSMHCMFRKRK